MPESFKVLVKEMRSLYLNVELEGHDMKPVDMDADYDDDADSALYQALAGEAAKTEKEESDDVLESIAAELGDLIGGLDTIAVGEGNELIGEGEEN